MMAKGDTLRLLSSGDEFVLLRPNLFPFHDQHRPPLPCRAVRAEHPCLHPQIGHGNRDGSPVLQDDAGIGPYLETALPRPLAKGPVLREIVDALVIDVVARAL